MKNILDLNDDQLKKLIDNRWNDSESLWSIVNKVYDANTKAYNNEPEWLKKIPAKKSRVRANRIFVNTEAVINSVIANPPKPIVIPSRDTPESKQLAMLQEKFFQIKYEDLGIKKTIRKGLRNLYFSRLVVLKPFWNNAINDFDVISVDPRKVRFSKTSTKEVDSEFAIEEVEDTVGSLLAKFPHKKAEILKENGFEYTEESVEVIVENKQIKYFEAWVGDCLIFKYQNIILDVTKNPYWDWDGVPLTDEEAKLLLQAPSQKERSVITKNAKTRERPENEKGEYDRTLPAYFYNHFDRPRKPYIFATLFDSENQPIGTTDIITQAIPLQEDIDETKRNITENARIVNGIIKVDSKVMSQSEATKLSWQAGGVIWGKDVANGVQREMGNPLPNFVLENLADSRKEIDDIMAASSAFRGVREGQETRGGRLALIDQSFLRLNELVQVVDFLNFELFNWMYQLAKVNYTETHYAKKIGRDRATETINLMQDDFEDGTEVRIIAGKTLPEDRQFKYEQAQKDLELGVLAPTDYLEIAGYDSPAEKAKNLVVWGLNQPYAVGIGEEEMMQIQPPKSPEGLPPKMSLKYDELPPDGKIQLAEKAGIKLNPQILVAEEQRKLKNDDTLREKVSMDPT